MKAKEVVYKLLESGLDDFDPKEFMGQAMDTARQELLEFFPAALRPSLQDAPHSFLSAITDSTKDETYHLTTPGPNDWWPHQLDIGPGIDDGPNAWFKYRYYSLLQIKNQILHMDIAFIDGDGVHDTAEASAYSKMFHDHMRNQYSEKDRLKSLIFYDYHVIRYGDDPLGLFTGVPEEDLCAAAVESRKKHYVQFDALHGKPAVSRVVP